MEEQPGSTFQFFCNAAQYRIRVCGHLTPDWSERLQGMRMVKDVEQGYGPVTELTGVLADQAALMGVLMHLYECGVALISAKFDGFEQPTC